MNTSSDSRLFRRTVLLRIFIANGDDLRLDDELKDHELGEMIDVFNLDADATVGELVDNLRSTIEALPQGEEIEAAATALNLDNQQVHLTDRVHAALTDRFGRRWDMSDAQLYEMKEQTGLVVIAGSYDLAMRLKQLAAVTTAS